MNILTDAECRNASSTGDQPSHGGIGAGRTSHERGLECRPRVLPRPGFHCRRLPDMRIVVNESAEDFLAVRTVAARVENVLMPELVEIIRPRHHDSIRTLRKQIQESAVVRLRLVRLLLRPAVPFRRLFLH